MLNKMKNGIFKNLRKFEKKFKNLEKSMHSFNSKNNKFYLIEKLKKCLFKFVNNFLAFKIQNQKIKILKKKIIVQN